MSGLFQGFPGFKLTELGGVFFPPPPPLPPGLPPAPDPDAPPALPPGVDAAGVSWGLLGEPLVFSPPVFFPLVGVLDPFLLGHVTGPPFPWKSSEASVNHRRLLIV